MPSVRSAPLATTICLAALSVLALFVPLSASAGDDAPDDHAVARAAELLERVAPHVERACGIEFPEPPRVVELSGREAERWFRMDLRAEIERRYADATEGQRAAVMAATARSSVASCLARYSFHGKAIVLVRSSFDAQRAAAGFDEADAEDLLLAVIAHEAVHALDDVHHDLAAFYRDAPDAEALRARAMVAEGRAVHFGRRAAAAAGASARACGLLPGGETPTDLHAWLLRLTYEGGAAFVEALEARDDDSARSRVSRLLESPPTSTHAVFHPALWPETAPDRRPARILRDADLDGTVTTLSELQLRARYAALHGPETATATFEGFRGGAQILVESTNVAVLAFADDDAARRYTELAGEEAPTTRIGELVLRAFGPVAESLLARVREASVVTEDD